MAPDSRPSRLRAFADAADRRLGHRALIAAAADHPVPGGARFAYVFGSALLFAFGLQALTGIALATGYSPSVTDAWASVHHIQHHLTLGWLVRGIHHFGSSAMVVLCVLHMTQVFFFGAWRAPREANWWLGVVMLLLVLAFGLTGYLLPWDQKGYWATQVAMSITGGAPGGEQLQALLQGGPQAGNLTLTRFYAIHVLLLPATLGALTLGHVSLFRRHGVTASPKADPATLQSRAEPFWPYQWLRDAVFALIVLGILIALSVWVGASLEAPADPAGAYEARPEWYFLFLFQLLRIFEGPLLIVGTVVIPGLAILFLLAVPLLDRRTGGLPAPRVAVPFVLLIGGAMALTVYALATDRADVDFLDGRAAADRDALQAHRLAEAGGIDASGRVVLLAGLQLFHQKGCVSCHAREVEADVHAPLLAGYGTEARLDRFLRAPDARELFGLTPLREEMEPFGGPDADRAALVAWLTSLSGREPSNPERTARGRALFDGSGCTDCHNDPDLRAGAADWELDAAGPDLRGFQGYEWVRGLLRDAGHPSWFGGVVGPDDEGVMPAFPDLSDDELDLLVRWLLAGAPGAD
ncbi:MAG: cytochrome b N-terminal domain-containing protein [Deltaproteobacteria bacterium]|nr:cytochrome b N-terminal domain-containing protein [Deltaproteobacteria bacterium]MCB9788678.1 cytochrome b N-terminal domain-containing protein [Deltaproteobacteria bacterium]